MANQSPTAALTINNIIPKLPPLGLGSAGNPDPQSMSNVVHAALQQTHKMSLIIDTAQNYGSETGIGLGLKRFREEQQQTTTTTTTSSNKPFLLAKVDLASKSHEDPTQRMRRQVRRSLNNLGVSHLDAVALHWPVCLDQNVDEDEARSVRMEAWKELERLVREEGLIGMLGVSNFTPELIDEIMNFAEIPPRLNEIEFSPVCCQTELVQECHDRGMAVVGYSPYGTCWMSIYHSAFVPWGPSDLTEDETVVKIAEELGCTAGQVLLKWSIQHCVIPIPKTLRVERVLESSKVLCNEENEGIVLTEDQMKRLDALNDVRRGTKASIEAHCCIISSADYMWDAT